eukprot:SM000087S23398  [mRNA]  locus=s87:469273:472795:+ [translate_table: standard]
MPPAGSRFLCSLHAPRIRAARWPARPPACSEATSIAGPSNDDDDEEIWLRLDLFERQLSVAIVEERFSEAARLRDELKGLRSRLKPVAQFMHSKIDLLKVGTASEKRDALEVRPHALLHILGLIVDLDSRPWCFTCSHCCQCSDFKTLGRIGGFQVVPYIVTALGDSNPAICQCAEMALWSIFLRSGQAEVDQRLQVIKMAPSYAEAYNKRATTLYLMQDFEASIEDCKRTVELNPYHFGALSGLGLCHVALKDLPSALRAFEQALAIHPRMEQIGRYVEALRVTISRQSSEGSD